MTTGYPTPNDARPPEWRSLVAQLADICKRNPAQFAAIVRETDRLIALGVDADEARRRAMDGIGA